jgi:hypothetical protein
MQERIGILGYGDDWIFPDGTSGMDNAGYVQYNTPKKVYELSLAKENVPKWHIFKIEFCLDISERKFQTCCKTEKLYDFTKSYNFSATVLKRWGDDMIQIQGHVYVLESVDSNYFLSSYFQDDRELLSLVPVFTGTKEKCDRYLSKHGLLR